MKVEQYGLGLDRDKLELAFQSMAKEQDWEALLPAPAGRERSSFLGGSEIAAVMGVSPWATPLDVYFRKTGERPPAGQWIDPQREKNLRRGKRAEPHAIDMAIEDHGIKVTKRSTEGEKNYYIDAEHPFLAVEIDAEWEVTAAAAERFGIPEQYIGTIQNVEVKSVHPFAAGKFGDEETDEVPIEYGAQALYGLDVTKRDLTMFIVLRGWDDLSFYFMYRDDAIMAGMRAMAVKFWTEHVIPRIAPPAVNLPDVMHLFRRVGAFKVLATDAVKELIADLAKLRQEQKTAAERVEDCQYKIGMAILGQEQLENPDDPGKTTVVDENGKPLLNIDFQQQFDINEAKLKAHFPAVVEACAKLQQFFVYRIPRPKKDITVKRKTSKTTDEKEPQ